MKVALINCYFGKLPSYFELWLRSCEANPSIEFILITDAVITYRIPENVSIIGATWDSLVKEISRKFDLEVAIESPYKLTDFKPAYGYIFEELLEPYDYWGYCDIDLIFGNLMKFIDEPMSQGIEKIFRLGHLTLYKNNARMRNLFQQNGGMFSFAEVFSNSEFYSFDEHSGQMSISKTQEIVEYYKEDMADISCRIHRLTASRKKNYPYQVFYYENGGVYRSFRDIDGSQIKTEEFAYIHLQKRKYQYNSVGLSYYILSDSFCTKEKGEPNIDEIKKYAEYVSDEKDRRELKAFRKKKIIDFFKCSIKEKIIWLKIKKAERHFSASL